VRMRVVSARSSKGSNEATRTAVRDLAASVRQGLAVLGRNDLCARLDSPVSAQPPPRTIKKRTHLREVLGVVHLQPARKPASASVPTPTPLLERERSALEDLLEDGGALVLGRLAPRLERLLCVLDGLARVVDRHLGEGPEDLAVARVWGGARAE